eukprot:g2574.t1
MEGTIFRSLRLCAVAPLLCLAAAVSVSAATSTSTADSSVRSKYVQPISPASIWPQPKIYSHSSEAQGSTAVLFGTVRARIEGCPPGDKACSSYLSNAFERFRSHALQGDGPGRAYRPMQWKRNAAAAKAAGGQPRITIEEIVLSLNRPAGHSWSSFSDVQPSPLMDPKDEAYKIVASKAGLTVEAEHPFGIIRALYSLEQLVQWTGEEEYVITALPLRVEDVPRKRWRGLMIDTARHFIPMQTLRLVIDALAACKGNVLHWHVVDSQSFPLESEVKPRLTMGAFSPEAVYSRKDVKDLISFARDRAVAIVIEIDVPAHAHAFGIGYPFLTVKCDKTVESDGYGVVHGVDKVALHPLRETTYTFLEEFLGEIFSTFPAPYVHLGGDEVNADCLLEDEELRSSANRFYRGGTEQWRRHIQKNFTQRVLKVAQKYGKKVVLWDESLEMDLSAEMRSQVVVQWWRGWAPGSVRHALNSGFHAAIQSAGWYLDYRGDSWQKMYKVELKEGVMGGEACSWSERSDGDSVADNFQRLPAVMEKLWSTKKFTAGFENRREPTRIRLGRFLCVSLKKRGVAASPVLPDWCPYGVSVGTEVVQRQHRSSKEDTISLEYTFSMWLGLIAFLLAACILVVMSFIRTRDALNCSTCGNAGAAAAAAKTMQMRKLSGSAAGASYIESGDDDGTAEDEDEDEDEENDEQRRLIV